MVLVNFNQTQYEVALQQLKNKINDLTKALNCIQIITGERKLISFSEVEEIVKKNGGFANAYACADLMNLTAEFNYLKTYNYDIEGIDISKDFKVLKVSEKAIKQAKDDASLYLDNSKISYYEKLTDAINILNQLPTETHSVVERLYDGAFKVNLLKLHNL